MNRILTTLAAATLAIPAGAATAEFGVTGITALETARLAAFCSPHLGNMDPCEVMIEFQNTSGRQLKAATLTFAPGTGGFLDLRGSEAGAGLRPAEIVPCLKTLRGAVVVSFTTFDSFAGRGNLLVSWSDKSMARRGDVDFSPAGITALDTARLSAFCPADGTRAPESCEVAFMFHDLRGRIVKQSRILLQPGQGGLLDLRSAEFGSAASRVEIIPCLRVESGAAVGSFRVLDTLTGHTNLLIYPAAGLFADAAQ
jgi:hypothetical protein